MKNLQTRFGPAVIILWFSILSCAKDGVGNNSGGKSGSLAKFAINGDYLYTVDRYDLHTYHLIANDEMKKESVLNVGFGIETILPFENKLFIGSVNGFYIYSLEDPAHPVREGAIAHFRSCDPVIVRDTIAYVTLRSGVTCQGNQNILAIYRVANINEPELVRTIDLKSPYGLGTEKEALYVCEGNYGLDIFDLAESLKPKKVREIKGYTFYDVIPFNGVLICYVSGGVLIYDIRKPLEPVEVGKILN